MLAGKYIDNRYCTDGRYVLFFVVTDDKYGQILWEPFFREQLRWPLLSYMVAWLGRYPGSYLRKNVMVMPIVPPTQNNVYHLLGAFREFYTNLRAIN